MIIKYRTCEHIKHFFVRINGVHKNGNFIIGHVKKTTGIYVGQESRACFASGFFSSNDAHVNSLI